MNNFGEITQRIDGTYVITYNGYPYHVIPDDPHGLFSEVEEYAAANPDKVTIEQPPAPPTLEEIKAVKLSEIAAARYAEETGGVQVNGVTIKTDRESQSLITGAALQATQDSTYTCNWKTEQGFVSLTADQIIAVATAIRQHVQASFDKEAEKMTLIEAAESIEAVQAITWNDSEEPEQTA
jgi:hypothetical protein